MYLHMAGGGMRKVAGGQRVPGVRDAEGKAVEGSYLTIFALR